MFVLITILMSIAMPLQCRVFNNPILGEGNFPQPTMMKLNSTYYIITATYENQTQKYPIHVSTDLSSWKLVGYVFDNKNIPQWSSEGEPFLAPRLYKIGSDYHLYFTATDSATGMLSIGVAIAPHPLGPYTPTDRPLLSDSSAHIQEASIINEPNKDNIYLIWRDHNVIKGRMLNSNGLSFYSTYSVKLLNSSSQTENISAPYYINRNGNNYIMYFQNTINNQSLQVSRSLYPLGPYGNRYSARLFSDDFVKKPGYASLVKDLDGKEEMIVFHTLQWSELDSKEHWVTNLASIIWHNDYRGFSQFVKDSQRP